MDVRLTAERIASGRALGVSGSKSETNRLILLQALFPAVAIQNASDSDDSVAMRNAISIKSGTVDIHHAGTAMRFLTAYFAVTEGTDVLLTGSERMKERPISILVEALRQLGADITYTEKDGLPPLRIRGREINSNKVTLRADVSSQYISALLLVGGKLRNGIEIGLEGMVTSRPYIRMTLSLLEQVGIRTAVTAQAIRVFPPEGNVSGTVTVESDWSSASYFYALIAFSETGTSVTLSSYKEDSLQGDSAVSGIYRHFGVETLFHPNHSITISKAGAASAEALQTDLLATPDIAQTIAVTCLGLGIGCDLTGLHTLKIKETDRLTALRDELGKLGASVTITDDSLHLQPSTALPAEMAISTYDDHRMAMAFAPLALKVPITIENAGVVSKSYPAFWDDIAKLAIRATRL